MGNAVLAFTTPSNAFTFLGRDIDDLTSTFVSNPLRGISKGKHGNTEQQ
jgi:hypothetical protein